MKRFVRGIRAKAITTAWNEMETCELIAKTSLTPEQTSENLDSASVAYAGTILRTGATVALANVACWAAEPVFLAGLLPISIAAGSLYTMHQADYVVNAAALYLSSTSSHKSE